MASNPSAPMHEFVVIHLDTLNRVIDFLRYSEAKHAASLTLASAWTIFLVTALSLSEGIFHAPLWWILYSIVSSISSILLSLYSFLPLLSLPHILGGKKAGPHSPNLLYFNDIAAMTTNEYIVATKARYSKLDPPLDSQYTHDLLTQISVISQIAKRKFLIFYFAATLLLLSLLIFLDAVGIDMYQSIETVYE